MLHSAPHALEVAQAVSDVQRISQGGVPLRLEWVARRSAFAGRQCCESGVVVAHRVALRQEQFDKPAELRSRLGRVWRCTWYSVVQDHVHNFLVGHFTSHRRLIGCPTNRPALPGSNTNAIHCAKRLSQSPPPTRFGI